MFSLLLDTIFGATSSSIALSLLGFLLVDSSVSPESLDDVLFPPTLSLPSIKSSLLISGSDYVDVEDEFDVDVEDEFDADVEDESFTNLSNWLRVCGSRWYVRKSVMFSSKYL